MKKALSVIFTGFLLALVTGCTANVENPTVDQTGRTGDACVESCDEDNVTCTGKCKDDTCKASCTKTHDDCSTSCVSASK